MVIYRSPDGKPGYHQTDDIHDAVGFVEQLRNDQGVEQARIFRLEEVNFEYRPYYRVELKAAEPMLASVPTAPAVAAAPAEAAAPEVAEPVVETTTVTAEPEAPTVTTSSATEDNGVGARRGLFGR